METVVAGRTAILRQEGRLVMGWIEELGVLRYGESVHEVLAGLEHDCHSTTRGWISPTVAARRRKHVHADLAVRSTGVPPGRTA